MPAFLVLTYDVTDADRLLRYRETATPALLGPGGGELVVSTSDTVHLPEAPSAGTHTVILRFEDGDHARRIYDSDAYQAVVGERLAATTPRVARIIPGIPSVAHRTTGRVRPGDDPREPWRNVLCADVQLHGRCSRRAETREVPASSGPRAGHTGRP